MRLFYFVKIGILFLLLQGSLLASLHNKSAMVYYGDDISYPMVGVHDYIILEPDYIDVYTSGFKTYKENIYAYVSVNEVQKTRSFAKEIQPAWILGENAAWGSNVMNITDSAYQDFLLERVIAPLYKKGIQNFFFDTLDSYQLVQATKEEKTYLKNGVIQFIKRFKKRFPHTKLITNRGFEMIEHIAPHLEAMLFESYYYGFNPSTDSYKEVTNNDRAWLDAQLAKVKAHNIPIIALDYLPHTETKTIQKALVQLPQKGFIPYISEGSLMRYGHSSKNALKREVLMIYNSHELDYNSLMSTYAHLFASMPIEYMGYVPHLKDVQKPLPTHLSDRYAGIIIWLERSFPEEDRLMWWAKKAIEQGVKVLFLGDNALPIQHPTAKELGILTKENKASKFDTNTIVKRAPSVGFEIEPTLGYSEKLIEATHNEKIYLQYKNSQKQTSSLAAKMPWGGYFRDNALMSSYFGDSTLWITDPFVFLKETLALKPMPVPDPTTENGKRLAFTHIDGDGSMNRVEETPEQFSIERIYEDFLKAYPFPQSVSIVEAETAPHGKYPQFSKRLEKTVRAIFNLPYVEGATHTFSHPFYWKRLEKDPSNKNYRIDWGVDYTFTPEREIGGSLAYVNSFIPKDRPKARAVYWSGDCQPTESILAYTQKNNIININGGDTTITNDKPWLQRIQPFGLKLGEYYQVYTGQQNENVYTNNWLKPFWGFKKVIQTFKLTDKPRRLKPIDIYYHFYSGSKSASIHALKEVYDWVQTQDAMFIYTSAYPAKVLNFYDASIAKQNSSWLLKGFDDLRTVRVPNTLGIPDIQKSLGVLGFKEENAYRYVHLNEKKSKILNLSKSHKAQNRLIASNARLVSQTANRQHFQGHTPIKLRYALQKGCYLETKPSAKQSAVAGHTEVSFLSAKDIYVTQKCR